MTDDTEIHELDEDTVARIAAGEVVERPASAVKELLENSLDAGASSVESTIQQLDENTVARIAAGEVVERPASAVKELVENSLDADASRIDVTIEDGGTESIRVADDGRGMTDADVRRAVRQHTTSKITDLEDLESGVATLGFRGEALHTIGSVSKLRIRTRPRADRLAGADGDSSASATGTELVYEGGEVVSVEPTGCPEGTTVEVTDLFYNTPARRKFLKTTATEFAHVNRIVTRYALANPDVAVSLTHDGREVFATTGQGDLRAAVLAVYGREVARAMIDVEADEEDLPAGPLESISGVVSHPETNRSSREYLATYVNGRAVTSAAIREGIMDAYGGQLGGNRYPFVVCFLEVPGEAVDVNVHPRKREVRFDDDDAVRRAVESAVEDALLEHGLLRSRAPRGRSAPAEASVNPDSAGSSGDETTASPTRDGATASTTTGSDATAVDERGNVPSSSRSDVDQSEAASASAERTSRSDRDVSRSNEPAASRQSVDRTRSKSGTTASSRVDTSSTSTTSDTQHEVTASASSDASETASTSSDTSTPKSGVPDPSTTDDARKFSGATEQRTLDGETTTGADTQEYDSLPPLRVLGQLKETYLVCETPEGLVLIDQHAADERVNYERLRTAFADDPTAQALASPVELELTAVEAEAFESYREALSRLGFYADRVGDRTVAVTTVPAVLEKTLEPSQLRDVLASFLEGDVDAGAETVDALADEFLGDLACYPSITGNTSLTEGSVFDLLEALDDCENPYACPHGRPVIVRFEYGELEDRFERDYPGHR